MFTTVRSESPQQSFALGRVPDFASAHQQEITMSLADAFARTSFARMVNSPGGRLARILVGGALIGWGYFHRDSSAGITLMVVGVVPLAAGAFNWCLISALLGGPLSGSEVVKPKA
jgi:hypothetical protein